MSSFLPPFYHRLHIQGTFAHSKLYCSGTHWKSVGDAMGISYDDLAHGPNSFKDGYEFYEDIRKWSEVYEEKHMVPDRYNHKLAEETTRILLVNVPSIAIPYLKPAVTTLMDDRLRVAMMYEKPHPIYPRVLFSFLQLRKLFIKYFMLPRPYYFRSSYLSDDPDPKTGRYYRLLYQSEPW